jgi:N-acyl-phosphatidylethanolamine-hydrolysing phospholipase D
MASWTQRSASALYTVTISTPQALGAVPDTASEKSHWQMNEDGKGEVKGFANPWKSYRDFTHGEVMKAMIQ